MINCTRLTGVTHQNGLVELTTDGGKFRIYFLKDGLIRIRCTFENDFLEDASYALVTTAWQDRMDSLFRGERNHIALISPKLSETQNDYIFETMLLKVVIGKEPFGIDIFDLYGHRLFSDLKERSYLKDQLGRIYHYQALDIQDCFYGFGEKTGYINKAKRRLVMGNMDTLGYDSEYTDPLYKIIPFYLKLNKDYKIATGLFYHNFYPAVFDLGCEHSNYWERYNYYCADGGELDFFFIYGPSLSNVIRGYTDLTGKTALPPRYALGYMGSTMYYTELEQNCDQAVLGFVDKAQKCDIPCDGFHLSSGYTTGADGKRYVFNWNRKRFKDPKNFVTQMQQKGIEISPNVKPGILTTNPIYNDFKAVNGYIKEPQGNEPQLTSFWGGLASLVDFTNPEARLLWKQKMQDALISLGISAIWNDNCEFELNDPQALCCNDGKPMEAGAIKALFPNLMAMVARQAILERLPNRRPYILNRAGGPGIQRYAQTWAGDNYTSWHSFKFNISVMLGMGLSGVANQGVDVGGFAGPAPEPELLVRWVQNAVFYPRFCIHSMNDDNTVTEPWMYPSYTGYIRDAIKLRYSLVPYLYSLFYEASKSGAPIMRPLFYEFQDDPETFEASFDFLCGPSLLVAGVFEKSLREREVYLPSGSDWQDWYTGERFAGGQKIKAATPLDRTPLFIRQGAIIPMANSIKNLRLQTIHELNILIYPADSSQFVLYEDDGTSNEYLKGDYLATTISVKSEQHQINIELKRDGNYRSEVKKIELDVFCRHQAPVEVKLEAETLEMYLDDAAWAQAESGWYFNHERKQVQIKYSQPTADYSIAIHYFNPLLMS
ncbi:MAG TPA: alpha-glucosidase [Firmicutes bacterium]|jgi:alpha-glucosidase|nr:alpha-glucosidase [Bacillota bacterium]